MFHSCYISLCTTHEIHPNKLTLFYWVDCIGFFLQCKDMATSTYFQWALMLFTYPCPNVFSCTMCAQERIMQKWDSVMSWVWLHPWHMIFQERHLWLQQCQIYSFWRCVREVFLGQHSVCHQTKNRTSWSDVPNSIDQVGDFEEVTAVIESHFTLHPASEESQ